MRMQVTVILALLPSVFINIMPAQTLSQTTMNKIDSMFSNYQSPAPGASIIIIKDGEILYQKGYGFADIDNDKPTAPNTNYRLASVTKQFTAMGIMILAEQGKISLDDPLIKYFPNYPKWAEQIKIINMLNHTSGIWDYEALIPDDWAIPVSDADVFNAIMEEDSLYFNPGEKFQYSNTAYVLLGLIIEKLSGLSFSEFLKEYIFIPLEMNNSSTNLMNAKIPNRAFGYSEVKGSFVKTDQSITSYTLGDGGIYSSVSDLFKWEKSLYTEKFVSKSSLEKIFSVSSIISEENNEAYGLGWYISSRYGKKCIWHSGNSRGFTNLITRFPDEKLSIIILTNRNEADLDSIEKQLEELVFHNNSVQ